MRQVLFMLCVFFCVGGCASGDTPAELISGSGYGYPEVAKAAGIEGWVKVRYDIDSGGNVQNAVVIGAEPRGVFDDSALKNVQSWKFTPRRENGNAVAQKGVVSEVKFQLSGADRYKSY
jgi:protein TonB